jgi:predicted HD phosphohydrolase
MLLAALLHDVGKAIDPADHVTAALQALEGAVSARTAGLIAHHMEAQAYRDGILGARARVRLQQLEDFDDLMLLCACDRRTRIPGALVDELSEVHDFLRKLSEELESEY